MCARVDAGGEVAGRDLAGLGAQLRGLLPDRDRVQVDDAEDAVESPCSRTQLRIAPR